GLGSFGNELTSRGAGRKSRSWFIVAAIRAIARSNRRGTRSARFPCGYSIARRETRTQSDHWRSSLPADLSLLPEWKCGQGRSNRGRDGRTESAICEMVMGKIAGRIWFSATASQLGNRSTIGKIDNES